MMLKLQILLNHIMHHTNESGFLSSNTAAIRHDSESVPPTSSKIQLNVILPLLHFSKWPLSKKFPNQNFV